MITGLGLWRSLAALIALAGIFWMLAPGPREPDRRILPPEPWELPQVSRALPGTSPEGLARAGLWGKLPDTVADGPMQDPPWRFLGVVRNGPERFVLIKFDGLPERKLGVNDELPGGSKILQIDEDSLCILVNGSRRKLSIYKTGPQIL